MFIPEQFPGFSKKTLVVVADHVHAKFFLGSDHELHFLEEIKTDHSTPDTGDHAVSISSAGMHSAAFNEKESIINEDHLFHALAKNIHTRLENNEFEDLIIAAGPEVHQFENMLHPDVRAHIIHLIPKLLTKLDDAHLLEHLWT
jgi:protein required for attachment to host cells